MIHILDSSLVPSTAQIIQIPGTGSSTPPAQVTGLLPQEVLSLSIMDCECKHRQCNKLPRI
jgi:hypothetical protein